MARELLAKSRALEKQLTPEMLELAATLGGEMEGLEYRVKQEDSLARKINDEAHKAGGSLEDAAEEMSDVVRYMMKFSSESYADGVEGAVKALEDCGMKTRVKYYWLPNQPYRGINVAVTAKTGQVFELQFHTLETLRTKHITYPIYGDYREETVSDKRRQQWVFMVGAQNRMRTPLTPLRCRARQRMKERIGALGSLKQFSFQTAEDAGLV